ncbi:MAG TPA: hypothetical protein DCM87_04920 [Planctomycetes bacterium]|nr:hypothetical protein [Planctomycetota bacterium]
MEKVVIAVLLTIVVGGAAVGGIMFLGKDGAGEPEAVAQLQAELKTTRDAVQALKTDVKRLTAMQTELANALSIRPAALEGMSLASADEGEDGDVSDGLRGEIFALIAEERKMREDERQKQREEADKRREERRKEMEDLSQGPYERLNLKVNSMAKALGLDDTQRDKYAEITKKYRDKIDEERRALFAQMMPRRADGENQGEGGQPGAQPAGQPGERPGGRGGFGRENFEKIRELMTATQNDYVTEVQGILTAPQVATFNELSESSQSFLGSGMAVKAGEDEGGPGGRMGDMLRGMMDQGRQRAPGGRGGR